MAWQIKAAGPSPLKVQSTTPGLDLLYESKPKEKPGLALLKETHEDNQARKRVSDVFLAATETSSRNTEARFDPTVQPQELQGRYGPRYEVVAQPKPTTEMKSPFAEKPPTAKPMEQDTPNPFFKPGEKPPVAKPMEEDPSEYESVHSDGFSRSSSFYRDAAQPAIPTYSGLWRNRANVGNWTGAIRPQYPRIRRPFGTNPREMFLGRRYTGMYETGYDASIVESKATPSFVPSQRKVVQDGAPTISDYIPALRSGGSEHVLFGTNRRR